MLRGCAKKTASFRWLAVVLVGEDPASQVYVRKQTCLNR